MLYICGYVAFALIFSQLLRLGQKRSCRTMSVVGVNYVVAGLVSAGLLLAGGGWGVEGRAAAIGLGAVNGVLFLLHLLAMMAGFRLAGVGVTWAFVGSGVVIPVLVSHFAWGGAMSPWQWLALGLVPVAVTLLRPRRGGEGGGRAGLKGDAILFLCFLMAGAIGTINKAQGVYAREAQALYRAALFGTTLLLSVAYMGARGLRPTVREFRIGVGVGLVNASALFFTLLGLGAVGAAVFFPVTGCLVLISNTICDGILWKETILPRQLAGIAVALLVVAFSSLGGRAAGPGSVAPGTRRRAPGRGCASLRGGNGRQNVDRAPPGR